jgi:hypothetical protein
MQFNIRGIVRILPYYNAKPLICMKNINRLAIVALALLPFAVNAQTPANQAWVTKSNNYTKTLLDIDKKYTPEFGSKQGIAVYDEQITVPTIANSIAERKERLAVIAKLKAYRQAETDEFVKQDLNILIIKSELSIREDLYAEQKSVSFFDPTASIFGGLQTLLDKQTAPTRHKAALIRLRKYAGLVKGYQPMANVMKQRMLLQMAKPGVTYPSKQDIEISLERDVEMLNGIGELFKEYKLSGWQLPYATLKKQLVNYNNWIRTTILPKTRIDFRLPAEEYKLNLEAYGIDIAPAELTKMAHAMFTDLQLQMGNLARQIAAKYSLPSSDYRDVIKYLKKDQIVGDSIMPLYHRHLADIETIIREQHLVTLPARPAIIRLASAAETAQSPAPHMVPPPFLNNTGQRGVFVLPLNMPASPGAKEDRYDDFTFDAASWTIIAHEARPGHELQFDKMVEEGVSQARALYAFNSTNVEGWGLYSESIILPYMPIEGQLVSLDYRLLRCARAFLDPELQAGVTSPEQALALLMNDVVQSHAFARQEVERYTVRSPGQANSYFYGYTKMIQLRKDTETALGSKFNQQKFHDFLLAQGILPPALLREAVMNDFVTKEK